MKTICKTLIIAASCVFALISCQTRELDNTTAQDAEKTVYFGTTVSELTKATLSTEDDAFFDAAWENGDSLKVAGFQGTTYCGEFDATWEETSFSSNNASAFFGAEHNFVAFYPTCDAEGIIPLGSKRVQNGNHYNGDYDVMISKTAPLTLAAGETFIFDMDRLTSIAYFHLTSSFTDEKVISATLSVNENFAGYYLYMDGEIADEKESNSITLKFENAPTIDDLKLWFNVFPGQYSGLKLEIETENHTLMIQNSKTVNYEAGKLYKVAANADSKYVEKPAGDKYVKVTGPLDDWTGDYLIVYSDAESNYVFNSSLATIDAANNYKTVEIQDNAIEFNENTAALNFKVAAMDGGYSIKTANGAYIGYTEASGNKLNTSASPILNTFAYSDGESTISSGIARLKFNSASNNLRFRYYLSGQSSIELYKLNGIFKTDFPTLNVQNKNVSASTINVSVPVLTNREWSATITEGAEYVQSSSLSTGSGSGDGAIEFRFSDVNRSFVADKKVCIHVVADSKEADIVITQTHKTGAILNINGSSTATTATVAANAVEYTAEITSNFSEWEVLSYTIDGEEQATSGSNCVRTFDNENHVGTVKLTFPSNAATTIATSPKTLVLTLGYNGVITRTLTITQEGDEPDGTDTNGWVKKELSEIGSDDVFVIVSGSYALPSDNTGASTSPVAADVTIAGNKITSEVADNLKWTVSGNASDGYVFHPYGNNESSLYVRTTASSSSNTSVRVGEKGSLTDYRNVFVLSEDSATIKTKDSFTDRYICLFTSTTVNDWRGYTTNYTSTVLSFYVLNDERQSQTGFGFSFNTGSYDLYTKIASYPTLSGARTSVTYESSNEDVAEVNSESGAITAKAAGSTTITATAAGDGTYRPAVASYVLTVSDSTPVITIKKNSESISSSAGSNLTIENAYELKNISDSDVSVEFNGSITAASIHNGTITYSISENTDQANEKTSKIILKVTNNHAIKGEVTITQAKKGGSSGPATMAAGTNGSTATVNNKEAIKVGAASKGGDMTITVPAGATKLTLYAAAWNGVSGLSLNITPAANVKETSIKLTADSGISGNSPFTLSGEESSYKFDIELVDITSETTLIFTSSAAKRFVVWGATYSSD